MKIRRPINPNTTPLGATSIKGPETSGNAAAFGADFAQSLAQTSALLKANAARNVQQKKSRDSFDLQKQIAQHSQDITIDFDRRKEEAEAGAPDFTSAVLADYEGQHAQLLTEWQEAGYDEDAVNKAELRLAGIRGNLAVNAVNFENKAYKSKVNTDFAEMGTSLSKSVRDNPLMLEGALDDLDESVQLIEGVEADTLTAYYQREEAKLVEAAALGLTLNEPRTIVDTIAPEEKAPAAVGSTSQGQWQDNGAWADAPKGSYTYADNAGGIVSELIPAARITDQGLRTSNIGEKTSHHKKSTAAVDVAPIKEMNFREFVETFTEAGYTVIEAIDEVKTPSKNATGAHWHIVLGKPTEPAKTEVTEITEEVLNRPEIKNHPILSKLTSAQLYQTLQRARAEVNRTEVKSTAAFSVNVSNNVAAMEAGVTVPEIPYAEFTQNIKDPVKAEQAFATYQQQRQVGKLVNDMGTLSPAVIAARVTALKPTDINDPAYAVKLKAFTSAQKAAAATQKARAADPAGYVMQNFPDVAQTEDTKLRTSQLERAYEKLGIPAADRAPFTEAQAEKMSESYKNLPAADQLGFIKSMRLQMGNLFSNGMAQLAKSGIGDDVMAIRPLLGQPSLNTTAVRILQGKKIMEEDTARRLPRSEANKRFSSAMGASVNTLSPRMSEAYKSAAMAHYIASGGPVDSLEFDDDRYTQSLRDVLGATPGTEGGFIENSGAGKASGITILPPTVTEEQYTNWKERLQAGDLTALSRTGESPMFVGQGGKLEPLLIEDIIEEGVFVQLAPGVYGLQMPTDGKLAITPSGGPFQFSLGPKIIEETVR